MVNWCHGLWEWFFGTEKLWNQETGNDLHKYRDPYEHPSASSDSHLPLELLSYSAVSFPHSEVKGKEIQEEMPYEMLYKNSSMVACKEFFG